MIDCGDEATNAVKLRIPNKLTAALLAKSEQGKDVYQAKGVTELFEQFGI